MTLRRLGPVLFALALGAALPSASHAQIYYPYGYRNYGWGGWGGGGYGSGAAGMGWMAAGQGAYNLQTAEARNINVQTRMQYNEYMYESLKQNQAQLIEQHNKEYQDYRDAANATQDRLRNHPTQHDIETGEALNVALVELLDPRYAGHIASLTNIPIDAHLVQKIQFHDGADMVSASLGKLTSAEPTGLLAQPEYADDVKTYRTISKEINKQMAESGKVDVVTVGKFRDLLKGVLAKVEAVTGADINKKLRAVNNLKAMLALCYMFNDTQALDVYLAGVGDRKDVTLNKLLGFMQAFNLTFGPAMNPEQNAAYTQLFQLFAALRDQAFGEGSNGTLPLDPPRTVTQPSDVGNFFAGVHSSELNHEIPRQKPPAPPAPGQ